MLPIVVIDDSKEDLLLTERVIRQARVLNPVHLFSDAAHCDAYFSDSSAGSEPALIFVDLLMFPQSGMEVLRSLKRHPRARASLSVMLTGLGDIRHIQQGYDAGAATFLIKPFSVDDFRNFLKAFHSYFRVQDSKDGKTLVWSDVFLEHQGLSLLREQTATQDRRNGVVIPKPPQ
jgi:two-component system response regulator